MDAPIRSPVNCRNWVRTDTRPASFKTKDKTTTVNKRAAKRMRLKGGASRNSTMLGLVPMYSTKVKNAAHMAINRTAMDPSALTKGIRTDGVTISNTTRNALKNAPGSREITASNPLPGQTRYVAESLSRYDPALCVRLPQYCHISAQFQKPSQVQVNCHERNEAVLGHWWCSIATISEQRCGHVVGGHNMS